MSGHLITVIISIYYVFTLIQIHFSKLKQFDNFLDFMLRI